MRKCLPVGSAIVSDPWPHAPEPFRPYHLLHPQVPEPVLLGEFWDQVYNSMPLTAEMWLGLKARGYAGRAGLGGSCRASSCCTRTGVVGAAVVACQAY
jgi:hypothetical protein